MAYDRAAVVARARRTVHQHMGVNAIYTPPGSTLGGVALSVRWHNRMVLAGNLVDTGFSDVVEGVNRAVFNREELDEKGIVLERAGEIKLTDPVNQGAVLILDAEEPDAGPVNRIWGVVKK